MTTVVAKTAPPPPVKGSGEWTTVVKRGAGKGKARAEAACAAEVPTTTKPKPKEAGKPPRA